MSVIEMSFIIIIFLVRSLVCKTYKITYLKRKLNFHNINPIHVT